MTQETTHTPEPWDWHGPWSVYKGCNIIDGNVADILQVNHDYEANDWDEAAAARIVACVNACEGMADPAAEIAELRARVAELEKEAGNE